VFGFRFSDNFGTIIYKVEPMKTFLFFRGYVDNSLLDIDWEEINRRMNTNIIPITTYPTWQGINYQPTWVVNPNYINYTPPNYTITTTPGTGTYTIPCNGTINTATSFSLTTSNTNGTTYTTGGIGGILTTGTATFRSGAFTTKTM
jgi:hypothetical protein